MVVHVARWKWFSQRSKSSCATPRLPAALLLSVGVHIVRYATPGTLEVCTRYTCMVQGTYQAHVRTTRSYLVSGMWGRALPSPELNLAKMRKTLFVDSFDWRPGSQLTGTHGRPRHKRDTERSQLNDLYILRATAITSEKTAPAGIWLNDLVLYY